MKTTALILAACFSLPQLMTFLLRYANEDTQQDMVNWVGPAAVALLAIGFVVAFRKFWTWRKGFHVRMQTHGIKGFMR